MCCNVLYGIILIHHHVMPCLVTGSFGSGSHAGGSVARATLASVQRYEAVLRPGQSSAGQYDRAAGDTSETPPLLIVISDACDAAVTLVLVQLNSLVFVFVQTNK